MSKIAEFVDENSKVIGAVREDNDTGCLAMYARVSGLKKTLYFYVSSVKEGNRVCVELRKIERERGVDGVLKFYSAWKNAKKGESRLNEALAAMDAEMANSDSSEESCRPLLLQDSKRFVSRAWMESVLMGLRTAFSTARSKEETKIVKCMVRGFALWNLETIEGCGLKWISKAAKKFLVDDGGVDRKLLVQNFDVGKTLKTYAPRLSGVLANNKEGVKKALTREHVVPISVLIERLKDWNAPISEILDGCMDVCLITAEEDAALSKAGFRQKRPGGWRQCYRECGIEVERLPAATQDVNR